MTTARVTLPIGRMSTFITLSMMMSASSANDP